MKNTIVSLSTFFVLTISSLCADTTIQLQEGWNLIGISQGSSDKIDTISSDIEIVLEQSGTSWNVFDSTPKTNPFTGATEYTKDFEYFTVGKGYFVKSNAITSITFTGDIMNTFDLTSGWNLVAFPNDVSDIDQYSISGYNIEMILEKSGTSWNVYDPAPKINPFTGATEYTKDFTTLEAGQGYWLKVSEDNASIEAPPELLDLNSTDGSDILPGPPMVPMDSI